ncbi:6-phosphofructokinase [Enhydrobacter aerosaccus]|uniref:Phosphofructokinase n=1 Tax=Enhydrobacter aerosaccus TaxID=225324 RepID=A0A1T4T3A5_9HYPH|nr:1-phosphofructokinase family hexose kinase [Enhydrobacter aerosaccus]SKA34932.1 6-phosphofructokinase [Enhydrobacter aerosaccus]
MSGLIATLTVNPALDIAAQATSVRPGHKTRTFGERYDPGGGGINVARVVTQLGGKALAILCSGGVTGRYIEDMLSTAHVPTRSIRIDGVTRISVTVRDQSNALEYRFVPQGPELTAKDCANILNVLGELEASWLVASGSLPPGVPSSFYREVARIAAERGMRFALDTSGGALAAALGSGIDLLKPSLSEFESILDEKARTLMSRKDQAVALVRSGAARMIALTLGSAGAILATEEGAVELPAIPAAERTGVGAGDSFLAGLVLGLSAGWSSETALRLALACGAVAVRSTGTAQVDRAGVEALVGPVPCG